MTGMQETLFCSLVWERVLCSAQKLEALGRPFVRTLRQCSGFYIYFQILSTSFGNGFSPKLFSSDRECFFLEQRYGPVISTIPQQLSRFHFNMISSWADLVFRNKEMCLMVRHSREVSLFYIIDLFGWFSAQEDYWSYISKRIRLHLTNGCLVEWMILSMCVLCMKQNKLGHPKTDLLDHFIFPSLCSVCDTNKYL